MAKLTSILNTVGLLFAVLSATIADWRQDALDAHNKFRAKHDAPNLSFDPTLNDYAQKYAEKLASENKMVHSKGKYGENLYMYAGPEISNSKAVENAVDSWYQEITKYNYNKPGFTHGIGHFTQVVWKKSKYLGIGVGKKGNTCYVVAEYDPPGNYDGQFPANVLKPSHKDGRNNAETEGGKKAEDKPASSNASKNGVSILGAYVLCLCFHFLTLVNYSFVLKIIMITITCGWEVLHYIVNVVNVFIQPLLLLEDEWY